MEQDTNAYAAHSFLKSVQAHSMSTSAPLDPNLQKYNLVSANIQIPPLAKQKLAVVPPTLICYTELAKLQE